MTSSWAAGQVSLNDIGLGKAYFLRPGEGEHSLGNGGMRSLIARAVDTSGDMSILMSAGDVSQPTMPHYHATTTEVTYVLAGVVRVWLDDQNGTRFCRDVVEGEFAMLPRNWIHAWSFAAPGSRQIGFIAPGGFERIVDYLSPEGPTPIERLRESEKTIDVRWTPDYPLFDLCGMTPTIK